MKKIIPVIVLACITLFTSGQQQEFRINTSGPDFLIKDFYQEGGRNILLSELRGKCVILDFFSSTCASCFQSLTKINALQKKFKDNMSFILIGNEDGKIRSVYERFKKKFDLQLRVAFDSSLFKTFGISVVPFYVWIDKNGIIKNLSYPVDLTEENIKAFLNNDLLKVERKRDKIAFDPTKLFLVNGNGSDDTNFLYRSVFSKWNPYMHRSTPPAIDFMECKGSVQILGADIATLYRYAYFGEGEWNSQSPLYGTVFAEPIWRDIDSTNFFADYKSGKNLYCYSLTVPDTDIEKNALQKHMQADLENYFGFAVSVTKQKMPCWKLVATKDAKTNLRTKGGTKKKDFTFGGLSYKNVAVEDLITTLANRFPHYPPFIDESKIEGNIDIDVNAVLTDFEDFKRGLRSKGLDLIASEQEMDVLIIGKQKVATTYVRGFY